KLNCIMGGRGTGKTTILYFLMSAIHKNTEENSTVQSVLRNNLAGGEVNVVVEGSNGKAYRITKTFNDFPQPHQLPDLEYVDIDFIFNDIECDFYEAQRIEMIGKSKTDRVNLLDKRIKDDLFPLKSKIEEIQIDLENNAQDIKSFELRLSKLKNALDQYENIDEEFKLHKAQQPKGINDNEKNEFEEADLKEKKRENEKRFFSKTFSFYHELKTEFSYRVNDIESSFKNLSQDKDNYINNDLMISATGELESLVTKTRIKLDEILNLIDESQKKLEGINKDLIGKQTTQQAEFVKLKQKFQENRDYINQYNKLSKRLNERDNLKKDLEELIQNKDKFISKRVRLIEKFNHLKQKIFELRLNNVKELNAQFEGDIIINLFAGGITDEYIDSLRNALRGSGMRYNELIPRIVDNFSPDEFAKVIQERNIDQLKSVTGIDESRSNALIEALYNSNDIFHIESIYCDDLPEFTLKITGEKGVESNYRKSDELSMGQRCTTVLPIIFAVSKNPLIIDQPEDNLDNKYISGSIHQIIKKQKLERQLIFITHNPNIPVLSDSENNIFLKYDEKSSVLTSGDVNDVSEEIVSLLEGGKEAFSKRKEIYGI
ncbi:MAG: hypothetical protein KDC67_11540, partial [Ignavibacteriae bacterium]|nr:hypothetical protein [Ignavibacteriota bacterium]